MDVKEAGSVPSRRGGPEGSAFSGAIRPSPLRSARAVLLPAPWEEIASCLSQPKDFTEELRAEMSPDWCFDEFGLGAEEVLETMPSNGRETGWWYWWVVLHANATGAGRPTFAGHVGFKGPPSSGGNVEIMYALAPSVRRQGLATEVVGELLGWAFASPTVRRVLACVDPSNTASLGVLRKHGFAVLADESDECELVLALERGRHLHA